MVRKLDTGERLLERDRDAAPANRIHPTDKAAETRHHENKDALFRRM